MDAKIVLLGERCAGLTSLAERFIQGVFAPSIPNDIGDIRVRSTSLQLSGINMKLRVFDKRVSSHITPFSHVLYQGSIAILLAFDISNAESFEKLSKHISELERRILPNARAKTDGVQLGLLPKVLVGLKADLHDQRQVTFETASEFARQNNMVYVETSAKSGKSVELPFFLAAHGIIQAQQQCFVHFQHHSHVLRRKRSCLMESIRTSRDSISLSVI